MFRSVLTAPCNWFCQTPKKVSPSYGHNNGVMAAPKTTASPHRSARNLPPIDSGQDTRPIETSD